MISAEKVQELPSIPAVYALFQGGECLYVGASSQVRDRLTYHPLDGEFDAFEYLACSVADLFRLEREWFDKYKPTRNRRYPSYSARPKKVRGEIVPHSKPYFYSDHPLGRLAHQVRHVERCWFGDVGKAHCGASLQTDNGFVHFADAAPDGWQDCPRCAVEIARKKAA